MDEKNQHPAKPGRASFARESMLATIEPGDLIDENAAASIMQVGVKTLRNWRTKGEGPRALKIGKRLVRYHRADLAAFINGEATR